MCLSPVCIKNPNYHNSTELIKLTSDTESQYLRVPCGVCSECLMKRQSDIVQRARCLALDHYLFFCTLTYNSASLPHLLTSTGFDISFVDVSDIQNMFKRIRNYNQFGRPFKYFFVSERGSSKGRPHVHGLIFIPKYPEDDKLFPSQLETSVRNVVFTEWRRNYGSKRKPDYRPLFSYRSKFVAGKFFSNFDCHYVTSHSSEHGSDDVAFYVTKYVLKPNKKEAALQRALKLNLDPSEYEAVWRIVKSRCICSKGFGAYTELEKSYVRRCISFSSDDPNGFQYINADGSKTSLARYYRRFVGADDAIKSVSARGGPLAISERSASEIDFSLSNGSRIRQRVSERDIIDFID